MTLLRSATSMAEMKASSSSVNESFSLLTQRYEMIASLPLTTHCDLGPITPASGVVHTSR